MSNPIFERWQTTGEMIAAEIELIEMGDDAIPVLRDFFEGIAKNPQGVAYRDMPLPRRCALEVSCRLGPRARPLESYFVEELRAGQFVAAMALESLGHVSEAAIEALAASIDSPEQPYFNLDLSFQSAGALICLGASEHPSVLKAVAASERAGKTWERAQRFLAKR